MGRINVRGVAKLKRHVRREFYQHGQRAVAIARQNARVDTGALKDSIRFVPESDESIETCDRYLLIAGGLYDERVGAVDYAEVREIIDGYLRSTIPFLLKFATTT